MAGKEQKYKIKSKIQAGVKLCQLLEAEEKVIWLNQQTKFGNDRKGRMFSVKPARNISKTERNISKAGQDQDADKLWWIDALNIVIKEVSGVEHKCSSFKHSTTSRKLAQPSPS